MIHIERTGELFQHAVPKQTSDDPSYEFSSSAGQEMQQVRIGKKLIVFALLPITNDCFAPLCQGRSIRECSLNYHGLAVTALLKLTNLKLKGG